MERETGIEPATNSLEGCDSTTELLPPMSRPSSALAPSLLKLPINWVSSLSPPSCGGARSAPCRPARFISKLPINWVSLTSADNALALSAKRCCGEGLAPSHQSFPPAIAPTFRGAMARLGKIGGEGRVRTSVGTRPADLQSAAIDRSATSPNLFTRPAAKTASRWMLHRAASGRDYSLSR